MVSKAEIARQVAFVVLKSEDRLDAPFWREIIGLDMGVPKNSLIEHMIVIAQLLGFELSRLNAYQALDGLVRRGLIVDNKGSVSFGPEFRVEDFEAEIKLVLARLREVSNGEK